MRAPVAAGRPARRLPQRSARQRRRGDGDGGTDPDAGALAFDAGPCPVTVSLSLTNDTDLASWMVDETPGCSIAIEDVGLEVTNQGGPATCRSSRDRLVDLTEGHLRVRLVDDNSPDLAMSFPVMVGNEAFDDRRWIYFERDDMTPYLGECGSAVGCNDVL